MYVFKFRSNDAKDKPLKILFSCPASLVNKISITTAMKEGIAAKRKSFVYPRYLRKKREIRIPNTAPRLSIARSRPKFLPLSAFVERSETIASRGEPRILPERSNMRNGMSHCQLRDSA